LLTHQLNHQLHQACAFPVGEYPNNEFLSKEQQRAQLDSESHREFMRSLG
jgi:hypothetical protein